VLAKEPGMSKHARKVAVLVVGVVAGALVALPAEAKPKPRRATAEAARTAESDEDADAAALSGRVDGVSQYTKFEDDVVTGETQVPGGVNVQARHDVRMKSLLRIRGHFIRELIVMGTDV